MLLCRGISRGESLSSKGHAWKKIFIWIVNIFLFYITKCNFICVCISIQILTVLILSGSEFTALPSQYLTHTARTTGVTGNTACALATAPLLEDPARKHLHQVKMHMQISIWCTESSSQYKRTCLGSLCKRCGQWIRWSSCWQRHHQEGRLFRELTLCFAVTSLQNTWIYIYVYI